MKRTHQLYFLHNHVNLAMTYNPKEPRSQIRFRLTDVLIKRNSFWPFRDNEMSIERDELENLKPKI